MGYPIFHSQYTAAQIEASIGKSPRINESSQWEVWDIAVGAYVDTGISADAQEAATRAEAAAAAAQGSAGDADTSATAASNAASAAEAAAASLVFDQYPMFESDHAVTSNGIAFTLAAHDGIQAANLAQPFSTSVNYLVGDYCTYDSGEAFSRALYRFTRNKAAGAWDATAVERVALADELSDGLATKQDTLTFDAEPTADSTNPVTSEGIKTYVDDGLAEKLNLDGYSALATVGNAEQLVSTVRVTDQVPYISRTSGGSADIGNREYDTVVGGSLPWNQIVVNGDFTDTSGWSSGNKTLTVANNIGTITANSTDTSGYFTISELISPKIIAGHKYILTIKLNDYSFQSSTPTQFSVTVNDNWTPLFALNINPLTAGAYATITSANDSTTSTTGTRIAVTVVVPTSVSGDYISVSNINCIDLTLAFGSTIADYIYTLETTTPGDGVAWFRALFPKPYYAYNAGELLSVSGLQSHDMTGFNQYNHAVGTAELLGGNEYQITGAYTALSYSTGESIAPDSNGVFTPSENGTLTVTGGDNSTTCVHLTWSGYRNGEFEPFQLKSYPLDGSLTLRGIPKLDADGNLYYDGDIYAADGTVTRRYAERPYESGDESLDNAITDGTTTVYLLATPTTETAQPFQSPQIVDDFGTERYVVTEQGGVAVPVGHRTEYPANLRDKLQHLPDLADGDGTYAIRQTGASMALIPVTTPTELPAAPSEDGIYTLKVTVADGEATYSWEVDA